MAVKFLLLLVDLVVILKKVVRPPECSHTGQSRLGVIITSYSQTTPLTKAAVRLLSMDHPLG